MASSPEMWDVTNFDGRRVLQIARKFSATLFHQNLNTIHTTAAWIQTTPSCLNIQFIISLAVNTPLCLDTLSNGKDHLFGFVEQQAR
jgi:hypothetical protein